MDISGRQQDHAECGDGSTATVRHKNEATFSNDKPASKVGEQRDIPEEAASSRSSVIMAAVERIVDSLASEQAAIAEQLTDAKVPDWKIGAELVGKGMEQLRAISPPSSSSSEVPDCEADLESGVDMVAIEEAVESFANERG